MEITPKIAAKIKLDIFLAASTKATSAVQTFNSQIPIIATIPIMSAIFNLDIINFPTYFENGSFL